MRKLINDGFAEICAKYPDQFPGWVAQGAADRAGRRRARGRTRASRTARCGVQIYTNVAGKPLDRSGVRAVLRGDEQAQQADLDASGARRRISRTISTETKSMYEIWWTLRLVLRDRARRWRGWCSRRSLDKYPNLKIITHHFGGIVPMLEGRIGPGWDQLGARTSDEDYQPHAQAA